MVLVKVKDPARQGEIAQKIKEVSPKDDIRLTRDLPGSIDYLRTHAAYGPASCPSWAACRRLGIILPSRDRRGRRLPAETRRVIRMAVADWFGRAFPGSTEDRMQMRPRLRGRWGSGAGVTVEEVEEMWTYCTAVDLRKHKSGLVHLAEWVATEADQEAVAILVDGGMELVVGKEPS